MSMYIYIYIFTNIHLYIYIPIGSMYGIYANIGGYIDGIHVTIYIAAPWIRHGIYIYIHIYIYTYVYV